jgi:hypothetical protein
MSTQHTPGPWSLELVEDRSIKHLCPVDSERMSLLTIVHDDETPFAAVYKDADARLIAAAPELLEACKVAFHQTCSVGRPKDWEQLRAAIAKATGETK